MPSQELKLFFGFSSGRGLFYKRISQDHLFLCNIASGEFLLLCEIKFKSFTYSFELLVRPRQLNHPDDDFSKVA